MTALYQPSRARPYQAFDDIPTRKHTPRSTPSDMSRHAESGLGVSE